MNQKPLFVSFEGIEGAGKSTLLAACSKIFQKKQILHICTREPGGTLLGEQIRSMFIGGNFEFSSEIEVLLLQAARLEHLSQLILPKLGEGYWVLCDRFRDSTIAYQGGGRRLGLEKVLKLEEWSESFRLPEKTIYLDISIQKSLERQSKRNREMDRIESEDNDFFERVREAYLKMAYLDPQRFCVLDGTKLIDDLVDKTLCFLGIVPS